MLFLIPTLGGGGSERVLSIIANTLCEENDIEILLLERPKKIAYEIDNRVKIKWPEIVTPHGNKLKTVLNYIKNIRLLKKYINGEISCSKPNVILSFLPKADMLAYLCKKGNAAWMSSERNDPHSRNNFERIFLNHIYKRTTLLVCQTNAVKDYYTNQGVKNTLVIRNPLSKTLKSIGEEIEYDDFMVCVGRLDPQKNYIMLIRAFYELKKEMSISTKLLILGEGPQRQEITQTIRQLELENDVILLGRKDNVGDYLYKAKFFVMSSNYEGMPNALIEAMSCGLPVVCTDFRTGAARELVDKSNGYLVKVGDSAGMKSALKAMFRKETAELQNMRKSSKEKVESMRMDVVCEQWKNAFWGAVEK